jgi:hypothetical protein
VGLPLYVNAALGNAFTDEKGEVGPSGGPNWNALPVWRAAAPHIDAFAPDIYTRDPAAVEKFLERYADPGPLVVPEIGNADGICALRLAGARPRGGHVRPVRNR